MVPAGKMLPTGSHQFTYCVITYRGIQPAGLNTWMRLLAVSAT